MLVVNADDFGISPGVNRAVVEAHRGGVLASTTLMANMPAFEDAVALSGENPALGVGVHLNLTSGVPVLPASRVPGLVEGQGRLMNGARLLRRLTLGRVDQRQLRSELAAQVERVLDAGLTPTHLDSHHHLHLHPVLQPIVVDLAKRYGIGGIRCTVELSPVEIVSRSPMLAGSRRGEGKRGVERGASEPGPAPAGDGHLPGRESPRARYLKAVVLSLLGSLLRGRARRAGLVSPDHFRGLLLGLAFSSAGLHSLITRLPSGSTELMCHPGYPDEQLGRQTSYSMGRDRELEALLDPATATLLSRSGVQVGSYRELAGP